MPATTLAALGGDDTGGVTPCKGCNTRWWPYPRVLAHRGGGTLAPENTLAGMRTGKKNGYRGVEFDVMLAADGVPVLMHDPNFGRTVRGDGGVATTTSTALTRMDAGSWHSPAFVGEPVPLFADVLAYCHAQGLWMDIEIKPSSEAAAYETGRVVGAMVRTVHAAEIARSPGGRDPALPEFSSFSMAALEGARATAPEIPRGLLVGEVPADWHARTQAVGALALHAHHEKITREAVEALHGAGMPLMVYTVNDPARARELFRLGVDCFCTDRLDLIRPDLS